MARKGYPAEFRRRALDLVAAGKTVAEVARLLEVSDQSIYTWRRQELIELGEPPGVSASATIAPGGSGFTSSDLWHRSCMSERVELPVESDPIRVGDTKQRRGALTPLPSSMPSRAASP